MKRGWLFLLLIMLTTFPGGCTPESEILFGVWQSKAELPGYDAGEGELFPFGIELYLGHYGPDVTGVVRFYETTFSPSDDTWHNESRAQGCACTFVENGKYRKSRRFTFRVDLKAGCIPETARAMAGSASAMEFDLALNEDDDVLSGTLRYLGGSGDTEKIVFQRDENHTYISEKDKACE